MHKEIPGTVREKSKYKRIEQFSRSQIFVRPTSMTNDTKRMEAESELKAERFRLAKQIVTRQSEKIPTQSGRRTMYILSNVNKTQCNMMDRTEQRRQRT